MKFVQLSVSCVIDVYVEWWLLWLVEDDKDEDASPAAALSEFPTSREITLTMPKKAKTMNYNILILKFEAKEIPSLSSVMKTPATSWMASIIA